MEKTYSVETFVKLLFCDKCGKQITQREGFVKLSNPLKSIYVCECGEKVVSEFDYPLHFSKIIEELEGEK